MSVELPGPIHEYFAAANAGVIERTILFQLFGGKVRRFSELERAIPAVSQKVLTQQLRQLERDGIVRRVVYPQRRRLLLPASVV